VSYLRLFQDGGWEALTGCRFRHAQSALAPYEAVIVAAFTHQPPATLVEASSRIAELTGVHRSPNQVGLILKQFGLQRRKRGAIPGPAPTEARRVEQHAFETQALTPRLKEAQAGQRTVFF
jgi:transposase